MLLGSIPSTVKIKGTKRRQPGAMPSQRGEELVTGPAPVLVQVDARRGGALAARLSLARAHASRSVRARASVCVASVASMQTC